jgi:hypothetical protein
LTTLPEVPADEALAAMLDGIEIAEELGSAWEADMSFMEIRL